MPIEFRCVECQVLLRTPDEAAGRAARCPECGADLTVPAVGAKAPPRPLPAAPVPSRPRREPTGRENEAVSAFVLGAASVGFFCCFPAGLPCAAVGLVLGIRGRRSAQRGLAMAGIALSVLGGGLGIAAIALGLLPRLLNVF
ncbi:MAG: hypothetical protein JW809_20100 [Pirellulales bacterium]|nr:hypothetical protein [Pirellulales bacterium]